MLYLHDQKLTGTAPVTSKACLFLVAVLSVCTVSVCSCHAQTSVASPLTTSSSTPETPAPGIAKEIPADTPPIVTALGYKLSFADTFDGPTLNRAFWDDRGYASLVGDDGSTNDGNNHELEWYRPQQVSQSDGKLRLKLEKTNFVATRLKKIDPRYKYLPSEEGHPVFPYISGAVSTKGKVSFTPPCYIEVELKVPSGVKGTWPAVWLLPEPDGWPPEIDILENVGAKLWPGNGELTEEDNLYCNAHWRRDDGSIGSGPFGHKRIPNFPDNFHRLALHWTAEKLTYYCDDVEWHSLANTKDKKVPDQPCYLILNLACGGKWPGSPDADSDAKLPVYFEIEKVRVWKP